MQTTSPLLIGREGELETLAEALDDSRAGITRAVVVGGEAGIGKTRLVGEFLAGVPGDTVVVRGQCIDLDRDAPPYAPVVAALRGLAAALGADTLIEAAGPARDALLVLLPELREAADSREAASVARPTASVVPGAVTAAVGADRLYDAVAGAFEGAARLSPLVVVIEDLHWADTATIGILRFLVRVTEQARILFVVTYRSDELDRGHTLRPWIPELDRNRRVSRLELARLGRRQVRQLALALRGEPLAAHDLAVVVQRTDGVPFFIEEILGCDFDTVESLPDTLREILLARYDTLGEATQRMLRLLAAGGARVDHELFAAVSDAAPDAIDDAAREAVLARVLEVDDTAYSFRHALVREAVHEQLLPGERKRFHTAYARALEGRQSALSSDASAISYHWMAARDARAALAASLTAMQQARSSFASSAAARLGERVLDLWDQVPDAAELAGRSRLEVLGETAYTLRNAGESERAVTLVDEALTGLDPHDDPDQYARLLRAKASFLANLGEVGSIELLRNALRVLEGRPQSVLRANVLGELAARLMLDACFDDAVRTADAAYAEARSVGSRARMSVSANVRGTARLFLGGVDEGLADLELAGELAEDDDSAQLRHAVNLSDAMNLLGRFDDAIRIAEAGAARARERGVERTSGATLVNNVVSPLFSSGRVEEAGDLLDRALELDAPIGFSAHLQRLKLQATLWSGDVAQAERLLRGWRSGLGRQRRIDAQSRLGLAAVAGEIALAAGRIADAWSEVSLIVEPGHRSFPAYDLPLAAIAAHVVASARAARTDLGADLATLEERLHEVVAGASRWPTAPDYAALVRAELETAGPRSAAAPGEDPGCWEAAVEAVSVTTAPAQLRPYALHRLAGALAASGDRAGARRLAHEARTAAEHVGAGLIVARVDDLERRIGLARVPMSRTAEPAAETGLDAAHSAARPASAALPARRALDDDLTERERQVLGLLAQGLSNKQIAEVLYISAKTASVHVSNILRKTGTATRAEAAFLARSLGLPESGPRAL